MKYVIVLGDGMADYKLDALNGKTPLMTANAETIKKLASQSEVGLVKTIPDGMKPGSDTANLSVLGYDPKKYYTGRSPLEAASIGIDLKATDVTARANLVTLSGEEVYEDKTMLDYSSGEITTAEASELIHYLAERLDTADKKLYAGISYRHCFVVDNGSVAGDLTPPHDITDRKIKEYLPKSEIGKGYLELMKKSYELLKNHPINLARVKAGKNPANSLWFWGEGTKPMLDEFYSLYGKKGAMISAVDLLKGIAKISGMKNIEVEGATGNYDTNFSGKCDACLNALKEGYDFVYIHMEAPDECGHHGDIEHKIYSIEQIDKKVVKPLIDGLENMGEEYNILILPDHPTPIATRTHASDPVPYLLYKSHRPFGGKTVNAYNEDLAKESGNYEAHGYNMIKKLFEIV